MKILLDRSQSIVGLRLYSLITVKVYLVHRVHHHVVHKVSSTENKSLSACLMQTNKLQLLVLQKKIKISDK